MVTDTTEKGLEALIAKSLIGNGWLPADPQDYERAHCVDLRHLSAFLSATQPETAAALDLDTDSTTRRRFLDRLKREVGTRGIIDVLRKGIQHGPNEITLFYGTPTPGNTQAEERYRQNRFSVTRQLRYSASNQQLSLDIALFVNGLPSHHDGTQEPVHRTDRRRRRGAVQNIPKSTGGPLPAGPVRRPLRSRR